MSPMNKLVTYSLSMIILPLLSYFLSNYFFQTITDSHWSSIYSAVVAVLVVHCVLISFVIQAYREDRATEMEKKSD